MRGLTILLVAVGIIAGALGETEDTQETPECLEATKEAEACRLKAYKNYQAVFQKGNDNRPDWMARKSCNYLTETIETCGASMVGPCYSEDQLNEEKDKQIAVALKQVESQVTGWDSSKCPVITAHKERLQAAPDAEAAAGKTPEGDPTGSSTAMTASVLTTLILAIFI